MNLNIIPSTQCSMGCSWCYLEGTRSTKTLSLKQAKLALRERTFDTIEFYGGEITELDDEYVEEILRIARPCTSKPINIITNYLTPKDYLKNCNLCVSWDYHQRPSWAKVFWNMMNCKQEITLLTLAHQELLEEDRLDGYVHLVNSLGSKIKAVEIKEYSKSEHSLDIGDASSFHEILKRLLLHPDRKFPIANKSIIEDRGNEVFTPFLLPSGSFAVVDFKDGHEFFYERGDLRFVQEHYEEQLKRKDKNLACLCCTYYDGCLSEHRKEGECNGHPQVLYWYDHLERQERNLLQTLP